MQHNAELVRADDADYACWLCLTEFDTEAEMNAHGNCEQSADTVRLVADCLPWSPQCSCGEGDGESLCSYCLKFAEDTLLELWNMGYVVRRADRRFRST